jgi:hypothetical protein
MIKLPRLNSAFGICDTQRGGLRLGGPSDGARTPLDTVDLES